MESDGFDWVESVKVVREDQMMDIYLRSRVNGISNTLDVECERNTEMEHNSRASVGYNIQGITSNSKNGQWKERLSLIFLSS